MATTLPTPIRVRVGVAEASCSAAQFRATLLNGEKPPAITHVVLGVEREGAFESVEGIRVDTQEPSTQTAHWEQGEYDRFAALPEVQVALGRMKAMHDYIAGGREGDPPF